VNEVGGSEVLTYYCDFFTKITELGKLALDGNKCDKVV
jgi:hypothetical protein